MYQSRESKALQKRIESGETKKKEVEEEGVLFRLNRIRPLFLVVMVFLLHGRTLRKE